ncbi:MAG: mechanosensitive ion channel family protein [Candidatus Latescibacterota bacterium]|nr:MAG: mechanosensitive ion channel family protein [Candidatus Latescibacterota bacterium]
MDRLIDRLPPFMSDRYVIAVLIVVAAFIAATIVDLIVSRIFLTLTRRTSTTYDDRLVDIMHHPVRTTVLLFGLGIATQYLPLPEYLPVIVINVLKTIGILVWCIFAIRFVGLTLTNMTRADRFTFVEPRTKPLFDNIARIIIVAIAIYFVFLFWGVEVTAWLASAGVIGIAVGFAAKDTLANLFSGIFILADAPYKMGDFINLDTGERGEVTHIGLRSTRILTRDDVEVTLPNAVIANAKIVNESGGPTPKHRVRTNVGVAYGSDVDKVRAILQDVGKQNSRTCDDPEPRVRFRRFGDSSLDFDLLCWIDDPASRGLVLDELNTAIYKRFADEGVQIPFPQRDLHIKEMPQPRGQ